MAADADVIQRFYTAFQKGDYGTMQACYHEQAVFNDPAFKNLSAREVRAMWQMLLSSSNDLRVEFRVAPQNSLPSAHWDAYYTFSRTGRKVHNSIDASFELKDGKIFRHTDVFSFWRWSRQALGATGLLLGWSAFLQKKVQAMARKSLDQFMTKNSL